MRSLVLFLLVIISVGAFGRTNPLENQQEMICEAESLELIELNILPLLPIYIDSFCDYIPNIERGLTTTLMITIKEEDGQSTLLNQMLLIELWQFGSLPYFHYYELIEPYR